MLYWHQRKPSDRVPVPVLGWRTQGELEWFDEGAFLEATWNLATCDAGVEFDVALPTGASGLSMYQVPERSKHNSPSAFRNS